MNQLDKPRGGCCIQCEHFGGRGSGIQQTHQRIAPSCAASILPVDWHLTAQVFQQIDRFPVPGAVRAWFPGKQTGEMSHCFNCACSDFCKWMRRFRNECDKNASNFARLYFWPWFQHRFHLRQQTLDLLCLLKPIATTTIWYTNVIHFSLFLRTSTDWSHSQWNQSIDVRADKSWSRFWFYVRKFWRRVWHSVLLSWKLLFLLLLVWSCF